MLASCRLTRAAAATQPRSRVVAAAARLQRVPGQMMGTTRSGLATRPLPGRVAPIALPSSSSTDAARRKIVAASFLGVGAPEALLVAVVALVVFGPKGLADAAKSLGQALRAFQPTIREVVEVSQDLRGTLEKELGLDEIREAARVPPPVPRPRPVTSSSPEEDDPDIEAKRAASAAAAWSSGGGAEPAAAAPEAPSIPQQLQQPTKDLGALSMEELEAELARRKAAGGQKQA